MVASDGGRFRGKVPQWRHAKCFLDLGEWNGAMGDLPGWDLLSSEDQASVQGVGKPIVEGSTPGMFSFLSFVVVVVVVVHYYVAPL
jgi:hypothetical protein